MKTRRRNFSNSEDVLTINQRNTRSKTSENGRIENSELIPIDLVIEILSRLPAKSIARCRCVSKKWASLLRLPDFTETFLNRSRSRPQLLFACQKNSELFIFSSPQPVNPDDDDDNSSLVSANYHMSFPSDFRLTTVHGLICLQHLRSSKNEYETVPEICNPSTGQSLTLPKVKTSRVWVSCYFGYDPIEKQYKILSMTRSIDGANKVFKEHQVLTLGAGESSWKLIECGIPHYSVYEGICINGVLYYPACHRSSLETSIIVCFDIRSEKFSFIRAMGTLNSIVLNGSLVHYNDKLGLLRFEGSRFFNGSSRSFKLWVL